MFKINFVPKMILELPNYIYVSYKINISGIFDWYGGGKYIIVYLKQRKKIKD